MYQFILDKKIRYMIYDIQYQEKSYSYMLAFFQFFIKKEMQ